MKNLLLIVGFALVTIQGAVAQGNIVEKYFKELSGDDTYTKVSVSSKMFSLFTELEAGSDAEKEFISAVSKLKGLKIIASDSTPTSRKMYDKVRKDVKSAGYEELMSIMDAEEDMQFSIKEKGGKIEELIMVVGGKKKFVFLSLYGEIDLKNISKIAQSMKVGGLENLGKLDDN